MFNVDCIRYNEKGYFVARIRLSNLGIKSLMLFLILILAMVTVNSTHGVPLPDWTIVITATTTSYSSSSTLGVSNNALNTFDPNYDSLAAPDPPTGLNSWFYYPNYPTSPVNLQRLSTSDYTIRAHMDISSKDNQHFRNRNYIME